MQYCIKIGQLAVENQGREDEDVFGPLFGAHGFEEGAQHVRNDIRELRIRQFEEE